MKNDFTRRGFIKAAGAAALAGAGRGAFGQAGGSRRPNILWLSTEDIGPHLGCYGDPHAITPTIDQLAAEGIRYTHAYTVAGVCAPNRSSIITGIHATTLGTHHMRSGGEGTERSIKPALPDEIRCFPELLRDAGYYCTNNSKEDYNFSTDRRIWDESSGDAHWRNRSGDRPFFAVFNFQGSHEGSVNAGAEAHARKTANFTEDQRQNPDAITPPPFHPNTAKVRECWAQYYENITALDYWVADHLRALEDAGLADNTIVMFWSDHGAGVPRSKRWLYDSGVHVPVIVRFPEAMRNVENSGVVNEELVSSLDLGPTTLNLARVAVPEYMQGQPFLGDGTPAPRTYAYGHRDRMDERYDIIRMVRDKRFKYLRNYEPWKPYDQFMNSAEKSVIKQELHRLAKEGDLPDGAQWVTAESKPVEELYDCDNDPHELHNLAADPAYVATLKRMRAAHEAWMTETRDLGLIPESQLADLAERFGTRYAIMPGLIKERPKFPVALHEAAAEAANPGVTDMNALKKRYEDTNAAIRYWAVIGLANLDDRLAARDTLMRAAYEDDATVRVAAARALLMDGVREDDMRGVLRDALASDAEWVRLQAALALDAVGEKARPLVPELKEALNDTHNKYVVRVANRAVNLLLGTENEVR